MLRYAVLLIFIVVGFILSRHRRLYPIVAIVYLIALFYYTFLSRMELATTTEAVVSTHVVQQPWYVKVAYEIFRMKTSSYREAFILNIMLFVPMGYLIPALLHRHAGEKESAVHGEYTAYTIRSTGSDCQSGKGRGDVHRWLCTVLICSAVSLTIEILQQLTGFGMFDWNDWIANSIGATIGVVLIWMHRSSKAG